MVQNNIAYYDMVRWGDEKTWVKIPSIAIAFIRLIVYLSSIKSFSSFI